MSNSIDDRAYKLATDAKDGVISIPRLAKLLGVTPSAALVIADRVVQSTDAKGFSSRGEFFLSV